MKKFITIMATLLTVITVTLTTYGGSMVLGSITTADAATTINIDQPIEATHDQVNNTAAGTKVIIKDNFDDVLGTTTATQGDQYTLKEDDVLEAKRSLDTLMKTSGKTSKVSMKQMPVVHAASTNTNAK